MANQLEEKITAAQEHYRWLLGRDLTRAERMHLRKSISEIFGVKMDFDIDEEGRMLSETDTTEVITMSEDTTQGNEDQTSNDVEAIDVEKYRELLGRDLTEDEVTFLEEIQAGQVPLFL